MNTQTDPTNSSAERCSPALSRRERRLRAKLNGGLGTNGRGRGPNPLDPLVDDRQVRAFDLRATGATLKQIAQQLGINRETAQLDISMEGRRRAEERGEERRSLVEEAAARYERSLSRLELRAQQLQQLFTEELRTVDGVGMSRSPNQGTIFKLTMGLAAVERAKAIVGKSHDLVLGLSTPMNVAPIVDVPKESTTLTDMIDMMTPEQRVYIRQEAARLRREREVEETRRFADPYQE